MSYNFVKVDSVYNEGETAKTIEVYIAVDKISAIVPVPPVLIGQGLAPKGAKSFIKCVGEPDPVYTAIEVRELVFGIDQILGLRI